MKAKAAKQPSKTLAEPAKQLENLGKRIRQLRVEQKYQSYEMFAYEHGISRAQMGRYENGQDLRFSTLVKLTNAFGITLEEFFSEGFE